MAYIAGKPEQTLAAGESHGGEFHSLEKNVAISEIKPVGNYALQLCFDDGHDTGLYSWDYLYELCQQREQYWDRYLAQLHAAGASRDPDIQVVQFDP